MAQIVPAPTLASLIATINELLRRLAVADPVRYLQRPQYVEGKRLFGYTAQTVLQVVNDVLGPDAFNVAVTDHDRMHVEVSLRDPATGQWSARPGVPTSVGERMDEAGRKTSAIVNALVNFTIANDAYLGLIYLPADDGSAGVQFLTFGEPLPEGLNPDVLALDWDGGCQAVRQPEGEPRRTTPPARPGAVKRSDLEQMLYESYRADLRALAPESRAVLDAYDGTPDAAEVQQGVLLLLMARDLERRCAAHGWPFPADAGRQVHPAARTIVDDGAALADLEALPDDQLVAIWKERQAGVTATE